MATDPRDRLFNDRPGKHYRRTYDVREVRWGALVVVGLLGVGGWVWWKGTQPNPALFAAAPPMPHRGPADVDRGPLPAGLAPSGWTEGGLAIFGPDNVYEKINGREGFYKSFGFQTLTFVSYLDPNDETRGIDVEVYDLGTADNAVGCLLAEAGEGRTPEVVDGGLVWTDSNARYLARGPLYVRLVGSDASADTQAALDLLQAALVAGMPAGELPWTFALFVGQLELPASSLQVFAQDAFSIAGADEVHVAELDDDGTALFVMRGGVEQAELLQQGFLQLGVLQEDGWVRDKYQDRLSRAVVRGDVVAGVYSVGSVAQGEVELARLLAALDAVAVPGAAGEEEVEDGDGGGEQYE